MIAVVYYLLQVITCSAFLYIFYMIALRNKAFHYWNRFYLLIAVLLSVFLPLVKIDISAENHISVFKAAVPIVKAFQSGDVFIGRLSVPHQEPGGTSGIITVITVGYMFVSALIVSAFFLAILKIKRIIRRYENVSMNGITFLNTTEKGTPFSFLNYIFWNQEIPIDSDSGKQILLHEIAHVRQKHTYDKIFMQCVLMIYWINPFFWIIRRELSMLHEFIADKEAVRDQDSSAFAAMILAATFPGQSISIGNYFFQSGVLRRLKMLGVNDNPAWSYFNRLLSLPVLFAVGICFGLKISEAKPALDNYFSEHFKLTAPPTPEPIKPALKQIASAVGKFGSNSVSSTTNSNDGGQQVANVKVDSGTNDIMSAEFRGTGEVIIKYRNGQKIVMQENEAIEKGLVPMAILENRLSDLRFGKGSVKNKNPKNPIIYISGEEFPSSTTISEFEELVTPGGIGLIQISEGDKAIQEYGAKGKDGVIRINTKGVDNQSRLFLRSGSAGMPTLMNPDIVITEIGLEGPMVFKADKDPEFKGGEQALQNYISDHLKNTTQVSEDELAGVCTIRFVVNNYGFIYGFKITSYPAKTNDKLAKEIIGILNRGPKWEPGIWEGEKVNTYYTLNYKQPTTGY